MPNMTVPMQAGGSKSLPAEMKVGGGRPWLRMRAEHPGYGVRPRSGFAGIRVGPYAPLILNPVVYRWTHGSAEESGGLMGLGDTRYYAGPWGRGGSPEEAAGLFGLGDGDSGEVGGTITNVDPAPIPTVDPFPTSTPLPTDTSIMAGLDSVTPVIPGWSGPGLIAPTAAPPAPPAGYSWAQVLNSSGQTIAQILAISQGGSVTQLPNGLRVVQGSQAGAVQGAAGGLISGTGAGITGILGSSSGLMLIGGVLLLVVMMGNRR